MPDRQTACRLCIYSRLTSYPRCCGLGEVSDEAVRPLIALSKSSDHQGLNFTQSVKAMKDGALGVEGEEQRVHPTGVPESLW